MFINYIVATSPQAYYYYHIVVKQHMQSANAVILMQIPKIHSITYQLIVYRRSFITMWVTLDCNKFRSQLGTKYSPYIFKSLQPLILYVVYEIQR